jgi:hypothetical protein
MTALASLVTSFAALLTPAPGNDGRLRQWITNARAADLPHLHSFARGLELDIQAATAALTMPHHNGRTEGVNTKTKMIKRQMYGRAGFTLLRHRILLGLSHTRSPPKVRQSRWRDSPGEFWLWHSFRDGLIGLVGEEDAAAEQVGVGASAHLPFEHLDAVDVAFDGA